MWSRTHILGLDPRRIADGVAIWTLPVPGFLMTVRTGMTGLYIVSDDRRVKVFLMTGQQFVKTE